MQIEMVEQPASVLFKADLLAIQARDLDRDTGRDQANALVPDSTAIQQHGNVCFDAGRAAKEMRDHLLVQCDRQARPHVCQERQQAIAKLARTGEVAFQRDVSRPNAVRSACRRFVLTNSCSILAGRTLISLPCPSSHSIR